MSLKTDIDIPKMNTLYKLIEMGYNDKICTEAISIHPNDIEKAIMYITNKQEMTVYNDQKTNQQSIECELPHHDQQRWNQMNEVFTSHSTVSDINQLQKLYSKLPIDQYPINKLLCLQSLLQRGDKQEHNITSNLFFNAILPKIIKLALSSPDTFKDKSIPILTKQIQSKVSLSPLQCACILSLSFFGLHNRENPVQSISTNGIKEATFSDINFTSNNGFAALLNINNKSCQAKLYLILNYFLQFNENDNKRMITIHRRVLEKQSMITAETLSSSEISLNSKCFNVRKRGKIEDIDQDKNPNPLLIDFANSFIGGGTLSGGNCQEEILFSVYTECIVAGLFCEKMEENECIVIENVRRWNGDNYKGYGDRLDINYIEDKKEKENEGEIRYDTIVGIDAMVCFSDNFEEIDQYQIKNMLRELNKCYVGFGFKDANRKNMKYTISTGNWGSGAFGGDLQLKSMLQWISCCMVNNSNMEYYSFGHPKAEQMENVIEYFGKNKYKVKDLWKVLIEYKESKRECSLFQYIFKQ